MNDNMNNTIFYTLISIPVGYVMSVFINDANILLYQQNLSNFSKCAIITSIVFFGFLKGYTGNDLVTNIDSSTFYTFSHLKCL
jgi:hypothetical protein